MTRRNIKYYILSLMGNGPFCPIQSAIWNPFNKKWLICYQCLNSKLKKLKAALIQLKSSTNASKQYSTVNLLEQTG